MRKFGIDIMTGNIGSRKSVGRILLPLPRNREGWHDIIYLDPDDEEYDAQEARLEREAQDRRAGKQQQDPNKTTAKLAWDERGSQKKGTAHVRLDVTLPADQDTWEAEINLGLNPECQPVCRVALPDNNLCEVYCHGRMVTIVHDGKEKADWDSVYAEFHGRMVYAGLRDGFLAISVDDTEKARRARRCPECCPKNKNADSGRRRRRSRRR